MARLAVGVHHECDGVVAVKAHAGPERRVAAAARRMGEAAWNEVAGRDGREGAGRRDGEPDRWCGSRTSTPALKANVPLSLIATCLSSEAKPPEPVATTRRGRAAASREERGASSSNGTKSDGSRVVDGGLTP